MLIDEQAHGDHGDAAALDRDHALLLTTAQHLRRLISNAEHQRSVRAIDVRIQQAHAQALTGQGTGQVHRHRALAHAAFAAAHGDHVPYARNALAFGRLSMAGLANRPLTGGLAQFDLHLVDSIQPQQDLPRFAGDPLPLALGESRQGEPDHRSRGGHAHLINPAEFRHGATTPRIPDLGKNAVRLLGRNHLFGLLRGGS